MSKFFNETMKARNATSPTSTLPSIAVEERQQPVAPPPPDVSDLGGSRLEKCHKAELPVANILKDRFKGSSLLSPTEESYRALRTRLLRLRAAQGLRSVVVTSSTQGEGKTFTSFNLALCCAQLHGMRVLLVDADLRTHGLSRMVNHPKGLGLSDVLSGKCKPEEAIVATDVPNLYILSSGSASIPSGELLASARWQELIVWCNESFKLTLVDSPPVLSLTDAELITASCDGVLVVVRAQYAKRDLLQKAAKQIDAKKLLGVVYNATDNSKQEYDYTYHGQEAY